MPITFNVFVKQLKNVETSYENRILVYSFIFFNFIITIISLKEKYLGRMPFQYYSKLPFYPRRRGGVDLQGEGAVENRRSES